ncbi:hypothetical protein KZP23_04245 [Echinicola marina]|uniref:hypothetical protein n=1 Tax=Echinicola marina TaxID=2859768 RepID=UPI001CF6371E|nr:hypothetical protein [Echinicola marina]UCS94250.1 hypothetical protein KZP23_04245 [Echinicola marina]
MNRKLSILMQIAFLLAFGGNVFGQTFTYSPSNTNCDGTWGDADCWDVSATSGCTANSAPPPTNPSASNCEVNIVINDDLTYDTGGEYWLFGGSFNQISVGNGAVFTIVGNVEINSQDVVTFYTENQGEIDIQGELMLTLGTNANATIFRVDGDGDSYVYTQLIDLRGRAIVEVMEDGSLISSGPTEYNGNSSQVDVYGFFRTTKVDIQGGSNHQLNSYGTAEIIVETDIVLGGTSDITFNGDSEVDVGNDIVVKGSAEVIASENAQVYVCGKYPDPNTGSGTEEQNTGKFHPSCRLLPVQSLEISGEYDEDERKVKLDWSTAKENDNSHFEVERSFDGIDHFEKIGTIQGIGWSDKMTYYEFEDQDLLVTAKKAYYRVKQVSLNAKETFSDVIAIDFPNIKTTKNVWRAYPNPSRGEQVKVALLNDELYTGGEVSFRVFDSMNSSELVKVSNAQALNPKVAEVLSQFSSGLVVVEMMWDNHVAYIKVIL